jgi:NADPH:quinone reductase
VIAAASSEEKVAFAKAHGADEGVVYPAGPFDKAGTRALADIFKKACGENGADVIYDAVGGDYSEASLRAIAWEGRFLVVGFPAGIAKLPLNLTLLKACQVVGVFWGAWTRREPKANAANVAELMRLYAEGKIKPVISERYPLAKAGEAIARLAARKAMGKIVVEMA